jgi:hypothetical protein
MGLKDRENEYLAGLGHRMTWRRGHGVSWLDDEPGWRGRCRLCHGTARVATAGDGIAYRGYEGAMEKRGRLGARRCPRRPPMPP